MRKLGRFYGSRTVPAVLGTSLSPMVLVLPSPSCPYSPRPQQRTAPVGALVLSPAAKKTLSENGVGNAVAAIQRLLARQ